jgi:L-ascorbate metabolism protein UlaG (beta-lactamase superfamily)
MFRRDWKAAPLVLTMVACAGPRPAATDARPTVTLVYLGVAGWSLSDGTHTLLVDPYFSRAQDPATARPDEAAVEARTPPKADLVLVGHDHWDHALDAPLVARRTGAKLLGGLGLVRKLRDQGFPVDRLIGVRGGEELQFVGYSVRVVPSLHSFVGLARGGDVDTFAFLVRLGGREMLVLDTANFIERELTGLHPEIAIVAPGGRQLVHEYTCRLVRALGSPARIFTTHFDDFTKPPETPLDAETQQDLTSFTTEVHGCSPGTEVTVPRPFVPISL